LEKCPNPQSTDLIAEFRKFAMHGWCIGEETIISLIQRIPLSVEEKTELHHLTELGIQRVAKRPFCFASLCRMQRRYEKILCHLDKR
jgi:hypothetical protein